MLELDFVVPRARGNQYIGSGDRNAGGTCASGKVKGSIPNRIIDVEFRQ